MRGLPDFLMTSLHSSTMDRLYFLRQKSPQFPHLEAVMTTLNRRSLEFSTSPGNDKTILLPRLGEKME